jgi:transposase
MSKRSIQIQETMYCGIDVSAKSLTVAIQRLHQPVEQKTFPNNPNGHRALIVWLRKAKSPVRVSLEATGIYSLDLAFALDAAEGIEVAVLNPKVANRFAQTIRRSKTDAADAEVLAEYTHRMPSQLGSPLAPIQCDCARLFAMSRAFLWRVLRIRTVFTRRTAQLPHPAALFRT